MSAVFECELALEGCRAPPLSSPRARWMRPRSQWSATALNLDVPGVAGLAGNACRQLTLCFGERVPRDVNGGDQPVRLRKPGQQRQRAMRCAQTLFTPSDVRKAEVVAPVVGLERNGTTRRRQRVEMMARAIENESERRPCLAVSGARRHASRECRVAASRAATSGLSSVRVISNCMMQALARPMWAGGVSRRAFEHTFEHLPRSNDLVAFERFERRAPLDPGAVRRQQLLELIVAGARRRAWLTMPTKRYPCRGTVSIYGRPSAGRRAGGAVPTRPVRDCCP